MVSPRQVPYKFRARVDTEKYLLSLLKLPDNNYDVEILDNGLINFINLDSEIEFFLREQEIQEPIIKFINEKFDQETVFLFQPTIT